MRALPVTQIHLSCQGKSVWGTCNIKTYCKKHMVIIWLPVHFEDFLKYWSKSYDGFYDVGNYVNLKYVLSISFIENAFLCLCRIIIEALEIAGIEAPPGGRQCQHWSSRGEYYEH